MTSYIKILQKLDAFCTAHLQIKKFMGEFREQMPNFSTLNERYPIVFASPISDVEDLNTNQFTLEIYCVDIIQKDRANLNTIVSDCHLILKDLFIYYRDDNDADLDVLGTASISFVNNFDLDYVAGAVMTITFEVAGYGSCEIPMLPITPTHNDCEPATLIVRDSDNNVLYTLTVDSGATETQVIADSTYLVEYENGTPIESGSILAEGSAVIQVPNPIVCADAVVNVNSVFFDNVASGGTLNIQVRKSTGNDLVGSKQGQYWRIANSTAVLKTTGGATISTTSIKAEESEDITAPDATVTNSDNTYTQTIASGATFTLPDETINIVDELNNPLGSVTFPVYTDPNIDITTYCPTAPDTDLEVNGTPEGTFAAGSTIEVNITDGVNPVTPNDVTVVGDVVTIEVPSGGSSIDPDAQAFLTAASITDETITTAIDTLVKVLKFSNLWTKMARIYPFVGGTATTHRYELKTAAIGLTFSGGMTHDSNGVHFGGSNGYADTGVNASTLTNNNTHLSFYIRDNDISSQADMGCASGSNRIMQGFYGGIIYLDQYDASSGRSQYAPSDTQRLFIMSRTSSSLGRGYKDGSIRVTNTNSISSTLPSANIWIGAANGAGIYSTHEFAFASFGDGLSDAEAYDLTNAVNVFQTLLSRNV
jgi:hypothetical protein